METKFTKGDLYPEEYAGHYDIQSGEFYGDDNILDAEQVGEEEANAKLFAAAPNMNEKFSNRLTSYLDSECDDYDLSYTWEWNDDCENCEVEVIRDNNKDFSKCLNFRYDNENDDLTIELSEGCYYVTREFDWTVKYFWMLVCPSVFSDC